MSELQMTAPTPEIVCGALWANDLRWLGGPWPREADDYVVMERHLRVAELASAMDEPATVVRQRLERGCRAFVARTRSDAVAGWVWVSTAREWAPPIRKDLHFAPDECYGWDAGTLPGHRGYGLFTALLRHAGRRMAHEGRRLMWGGILDSNLASRRSCAAAGFRPVLRLTAILEPPPTRLRIRPADYADPELVRRAQLVLGCRPKQALAPAGALAGEGGR